MATKKYETLPEALAAFQADLPKVVKGSVNPHFRNKYVSLEDLTAAVFPKISEYGLSFSVGSFVENGLMVVDAHLMHTTGTSRSLQFPITETNPQKLGSALTYARRYALSALTGVVADEDDDGNAASTQSPEARQVAQARAAKPAPKPAPKAGAGGKAGEIKKEIADAIQAGKTTSDEANAAVKAAAKELSEDPGSVEVLVAAKAALGI